MGEGWDGAVGGDLAAGGQHDHWAHHGVAVLADGRLVAPAPDGALLVLDGAGSLLERIEVEANEVHGMTVVVEDGHERLWLADCGFTMARGGDGQFAPAGRRSTKGPRALLVGLDGGEHRSLPSPPHPAYRSALYLPTAVAVDEVRHGGSGAVWVADGYGAGLVHRFDADGACVATLDGDDGAGRFDCPHSIFIDRRGDDPVLLVADRGNARVQVFGLDGSFRRTIGEGSLTSPSAFATVGDRLVIAELHARVVVLDGDDRLVAEVGSDEGVVDRPGWPNALDDAGVPVRPSLRTGRFNSPHGLAVDADGRLLVSEWLIGGRLVRTSDPTADRA